MTLNAEANATNVREAHGCEAGYLTPQLREGNGANARCAKMHGSRSKTKTLDKRRRSLNVWGSGDAASTKGRAAPPHPSVVGSNIGLPTAFTRANTLAEDRSIRNTKNKS